MSGCFNGWQRSGRDGAHAGDQVTMMLLHIFHFLSHAYEFSFIVFSVFFFFHIGFEPCLGHDSVDVVSLLGSEGLHAFSGK